MKARGMKAKDEEQGKRGVWGMEFVSRANVLHERVGRERAGRREGGARERERERDSVYALENLRRICSYLSAFGAAIHGHLHSL